MSKMVVYLYLLIPLLFLSVESSSIRGRNNKNELVPLMSSRVEPQEKNNSLKTVNNEPLMIQIPVPREDETKETKDTDKKTKRPNKKRLSKIKPLRKKHRRRRDLSIPRSRSFRDQKSNPSLVQRPGNVTEKHFKNLTKNAVSRGEILKTPSTYSKRKEHRHDESEEYLKNSRNNTLRAKHLSSRNLHKHRIPDQSSLAKMVYPSTPKPDRRSKYTYKDLMADRKRLEQKLNYIRNMLNVNDSSLDESVRIRRRTESDRAANKIAKMFLTLSAVNGLHDKRRSKCRDDDEDDEDRVQDVWEKERRNSPSRKNYSSNEERYKVKKWIEFMKSKRSSGKTCPCMENFHGDESDAFPLEQKLPKGYFLLEKTRSSEESSEYRDPYYNSRDKPFGHSKRLFSKGLDQDKPKRHQDKKKFDLPINDLELYRSRAKQILQNAEEILDRIKEEEERRLASPNILMNQIKELTSRIQGDPRSNENDLIRKIQKNLGWGPLSKSKEGEYEENTFVDNVKSYILDPYEKAKALTDESTKMLSSYLLRNLGKIQDSSEEHEAKEAEDDTDEFKVFYDETPRKEDEKPLSESLAQEHRPRDQLPKNKEELQHWEDTLSSILGGPEDVAQQEIDLARKQETIKNRMEDIIKEQQKKLEDFETNHKSEEVSKEIDFQDGSAQERIKSTQPGKEAVGESKSLDSYQDNQAEKQAEENQEKVEKTHAKDVHESEEISEPFVESTDKDLVQKPELKQDEGLVQKGKDIPDLVKTDEDKELGKEIFDEIVKTINEGSNEQDQDPQVEGKQQIFGEKETYQEKISGEDPDEPQTEDKLTSAKTSSEKLPKGDYNSPWTPSYYTENLNENEENDYNPAGIIDETVQASLEDEYGETPRSKGETILKELEEIETELREREQEEMEQENNQTQDNLKQVSEPFQDVVGMTKPDPTGNLQDNEEDPKMELTETEDGKPLEFLEHADLVKEANQKSSEADYSTKSDSQSEELKSGETGEDQLQLEQKQESIKSIEKHSEEGDETVSKTALNEEELQNAEDEVLEKPKSVLENQENQEKDGSSASKEILESNRNSQSEENTGDQKSSEKEIEEDAPLQATFSEDEKKESSENLSNESLLKEALENKSKEIEAEEEETQLKAENPGEKSDDELFSKTTSEDGESISIETNLDEQVLNSNETPLKETLSGHSEVTGVSAEDVGEIAAKETSLEKDDQIQEVRNFSEDDEQMPLQKTLDEDRDDDKDGNDAEMRNSNEADDDLLKENLNEDKQILESTNPEEASNIRDNENEDEQDNNETSAEVAMTKPSQEEEEEEEDNALPKASDSEEHFKQPAENTEDDRESNLRSENPNEETSEEMPLTSTSDIKSQEDMEERGKEDETLLKSNLDELAQSKEDKDSGEVSTEIFENLKDTGALLKKANPEKEQENQSSKVPNPEETVQSTLDGENLSKDTEDEIRKESQQDDDEQGIDETSLRAPLNTKDKDDDTYDTETSAKATNSDEQPEEKPEDVETEETVGEGTPGTQDEENPKETNDETYLKEANLMESLESLENGDETPLGTILDNQENYNEKQRSSDQEIDQNSNEIDDLLPRLVLDDLNMEKPDEIDIKAQKSAESEEFEQLADPEKVQEAPLRSENVENEFDNKIEDETPLKSANNQDWSIEESSRSKDLADDLYNGIDDEDQTPLKSVQFDSANMESAEMSDVDSSENLRQENPLGENLIAGDDSGEENLNILLMPEPTPQTLKAGTLKVPKSIGQIMRNLDGKDKGDITSIHNLNPDKIDDIIGKIEQQNLEKPEVDCMKECACAEEIDTRSRNMGRYEIVKDFLHWMKDLKINRVLTDD